MTLTLEIGPSSIPPENEDDDDREETTESILGFMGLFLMEETFEDGDDIDDADLTEGSKKQE